MRLLVDTHIAIWSAFDDGRLPKEARLLIAQAETAWVSAASVWEIAIKHALHGRRPDSSFSMSGAEACGEFLRAGSRMLSITPEHAAAVDTLPRHHGDPFDRLLVAQALSEPLRLVTADAALAAYGEIVITV